MVRVDGRRGGFEERVGRAPGRGAGGSRGRAARARCATLRRAWLSDRRLSGLFAACAATPAPYLTAGPTGSIMGLPIRSYLSLESESDFGRSLKNMH